MKTRVIEKTVEALIYIAKDGTEFEDEQKCRRYELELVRKEAVELAEKFRIAELDDVIPINNKGQIIDSNLFRWYRVENEDDFEVLNTAYLGQLEAIYAFPQTVCIETCGNEVYEDEVYVTTLHECEDMTKEFWKQLGYKVSIEPAED